MILNKQFISVEGVDGVGKSTVCEFIRDWIIENLKNNASIVKQNRDQPIGKLIREFISNNPEANNTTIDTFSFLFLTGITETTEKEIIPKLLNGEYVITDRFTLSTLVYQDSELTNSLVRLFHQHFVFPGITILLDAPANIIKERISNRNEKGDVLESVDETVIDNRRTLFKKYSVNDKYRKTILIDASKSLEEVKKQLTKELENIFLI